VFVLYELQSLMIRMQDKLSFHQVVSPMLQSSHYG